MSFGADSVPPFPLVGKVSYLKRPKHGEPGGGFDTRIVPFRSLNLDDPGTHQEHYQVPEVFVKPNRDPR